MPDEEPVHIALQRYSDGEVGMRGAAEIVGCTLAEMMREANERGVVSNYDPADLESDADALLRADCSSTTSLGGAGLEHGSVEVCRGEQSD